MNRIDRTGEFWERVHAALDERRDPYADPRVAQELAERPELLEPLAELLHSLEALERTPELVVQARKRRPMARFAAAAVVLATGGAVGVLAMRRERTPQFTFEPSRGTVLSLQAEFVRFDGLSWHSTSVDMLEGWRGNRSLLAAPSTESQFPSVAVLATQSFQIGAQ
ncbi:MAG: hypothetical protein HUU28_11625 [Planctomycetaceae bacterium]|nr:hypothetical protein [Planctomycetaceae bacterium]